MFLYNKMVLSWYGSAHTQNSGLEFHDPKLPSNRNSEPARAEQAVLQVVAWDGSIVFLPADDGGGDATGLTLQHQLILLHHRVLGTMRGYSRWHCKTDQVKEALGYGICFSPLRDYIYNLCWCPTSNITLTATTPILLLPQVAKQPTSHNVHM